MPRTYVVYILSNRYRALYIGVTGSLPTRLARHREGNGSKHASDFRIFRLVHAEVFSDALEAIAREKQLKRWKRIRKLELILTTNPEWEDLAREWGILSP